MQIHGIIWLYDIVEKLEQKHRVDTFEVEQVFRNFPHFRRTATGHIAGEDLYSAAGQTDAGRYLIIFFIYKTTHEALVISARDMDGKERRRYGKQ